MVIRYYYQKEERMNQSDKDMVYFCLDFVRNNLGEQSQNVQCRNWLKVACDLIEKSDLGSADFMVSNLKEADQYFYGSSTSATTNTVREKIDLVKSLLV